MNILRFLICSGRLGGPQRISTRQMTVPDNLLQCYSYVCQDKAEFDKLSKEYVAKSGKRFWGDVDVFNTVTKKRSKVTDVIGVLLKSETEAAEKAFDAIPDNQRGSIPAGSISKIIEQSAKGWQHPTVFAGQTLDYQTPGDSQSGGAQAPAESKGTLSAEDHETGRQGEGETQPPDFAADLAANGAPAPEADAVGAGKQQDASEVSETTSPAELPPTSTPPAKRKAGRPAKK